MHRFRPLIAARFLSAHPWETATQKGDDRITGKGRRHPSTGIDVDRMVASPNSHAHHTLGIHVKGVASEGNRCRPRGSPVKERAKTASLSVETCLRRTAVAALTQPSWRQGAILCLLFCFHTDLGRANAPLALERLRKASDAGADQ